MENLKKSYSWDLIMGKVKNCEGWYGVFLYMGASWVENLQMFVKSSVI